MRHQSRDQRLILWTGILCALLGSQAFAGYKARPWTIRAPESYPASLTSEKVTIAIEPLFLDRLAAQIFDKNDMVTRGIMPMAIVIFNDNDFPVMIESATAELICGEDRIRTLQPDHVAYRLFSGSKKSVWIPQPIPRSSKPDKAVEGALQDLEHKFLGRIIVPAHQKGGGFLYLHLPESRDLRGYLAKSKVYIPEIYREDTGTGMIYFEIDVEPAVSAVP